MKRLILSVVFAGAAAAFLGSAPPSDAFVLLVPNRLWDPGFTPVPIDINKAQLEGSIRDGDNGETALLNAINDPATGWNSTPHEILTDILLLYTTNLAAVQGDGFPTIEFNDPINICQGGCLAATLTGFFHATSGNDTIDDADVYVDAQTKFTSEIEDPNGAGCGGAEFYIEGVMQHEIGHVIGLGHSNAGGATMAAFANPCDRNVVTLSNDDRNGADALY